MAGSLAFDGLIVLNCLDKIRITIIVCASLVQSESGAMHGSTATNAFPICSELQLQFAEKHHMAIDSGVLKPDQQCNAHSPTTEHCFRLAFDCTYNRATNDASGQVFII